MRPTLKALTRLSGFWRSRAGTKPRRSQTAFRLPGCPLCAGLTIPCCSTSSKRRARHGKKTLAALRRDYFGFTQAQFLADMQAVEPYGRALFSLVGAFMDRLDDEKRLRNILDFGDLEHLTVRMLLGEDGDAPTPLARALSFRYTEIMVDEYQDTNDVQDAIFRALSQNETNLFMVGDIKQSIYSFRLANPDVFLRKYLAYADDPAPGEPGRIILSKNFRSRREVTEAVNYIFENIMSAALGDVDYGARERLVPGADYPDGGDDTAELCLVETEDEDELTGAAADAAYVARACGRCWTRAFLSMTARRTSCVRACRRTSPFCCAA